MRQGNLHGPEDKELSRELLECRSALEAYRRDGRAMEKAVLSRLSRYCTLVVFSQ